MFIFQNSSEVLDYSQFFDHSKLILSFAKAQASNHLQLAEKSAIVDQYFNWSGLLDIFLKLGLVLLLIYATLHFVRKFNLSSTSDSKSFRLNGIFKLNKSEKLIHQLDSFRLTPNTSLHIIEVENRRILLSSSNQETKVLLDLSDTSFKNQDPLVHQEQHILEKQDKYLKGSEEIGEWMTKSEMKK